MTLMIPTTIPVEAELALPSTWVAWMIFICVLNGTAALACVVIVFHKTNELNKAARAVEEPTKRIVRQNALGQDAHTQQKLHMAPDIARISRKRKTREHIEFPFARIAREAAIPEPTQDRPKRQRIATATFARFPRRSRSFGCENTTCVMPEPSPLRRTVSCGDVASSGFSFARPSPKIPTAEAVSKPTTADAPRTLQRVTAPALLREIRLDDVLSSAKAIVLSKLREAAHNAVDDMLTSAISFLTYGTLLLLVRQYSAVAVGVSIDLGAFSVEL